MEAKTRLFERELQEAEEDGDPLSAWTSYLCWFEEQKLLNSGPYKKALQKSIAYFAAMPHYNTDIRLAKIYIKSANLSKDPATIFEHMLSQEIGTQHAVVYEAYATSLEQRGSREEAMRVLEKGIGRKAQPTRRLQKKLGTLEVQTEKPAAHVKPYSSNPADINDQSERNNAFYNKPGVVFAYPKHLVYPQKGGELPLEMLRASLPQYRPTFPNDSGGGEEDMEMTVACPINITVNVPVIPDPFGWKKTLGIANKENVQASKPRFTAQQVRRPPFQAVQIARFEDQSLAVEEESETSKPGFTAQQARQPPFQSIQTAQSLVVEEKLETSKPRFTAQQVRQPPFQSIQTARFQDQSLAVEEELERLCAEKDKLLPQKPPPCTQQVDTVDEAELELEKLVLEKSSVRSAYHESLRDKENIPSQPKKSFEFTPNTVDGGCSWPVRGETRNGAGRGFVTKLSFSEADSLSSSCNHSHVDELSSRKQQQQQPGRFNATLDCENRVQVKLTQEQLKLQNEFMNVSAASVGEASWKQESSCNFSAFHDSWARNQSHSSSQQLGTSAFKPMAEGRQIQDSGPRPALAAGRRPLRDVKASLKEPHFSYSQDPSLSFQPSLSLQLSETSFSVYEDSTQQESNFSAFHDSWANHSRNTSSAPPTGSQRVDTASLVLQPSTSKPSDNPTFPIYHAPLGVPVKNVGSRMEERGGERAVEQSFTQFDIAHPGEFEPASTPMKDRIDFTFDVSVIPGEITNTEQLPTSSSPPDAILCPPRRRSVMCGGNLSTIMEESGSYKSSGSSRFTVSSSSSSQQSSVPLDSITDEPPNPFLPQCVNFMLNSLGFPMNKMERLVEPVPRLAGHSVTLGKEQFMSLKKLTQGGFATIFTATQEDSKKALKVQSPPLEWEVAVVEELHSRLRSTGCHLMIEKAYRFDNVSVIVTPYYPCGSLLNLVNAHMTSSTREMLPETMVAYYSREIISTVATLHQCGILHADIKPDNLMLRNITQLTNFQQAKGRGLCLIDFGRAIDTQVFPEGTTFTGSNETDSFECTQMLEGKTWKWQVDYFGIAATIFILIHGQYMKVTKNPVSGLYKPNRNVPRKYDASMWSKLLDLLLNAPEQQLPLNDFLQPLDMKLKVARDFMFRSQVKHCQELLQAHLCKH